MAARASGQRLEVIARTLLAIVGAYAAASLVAATLARVLPGDRAEAALAGTIVSFAVFPAIVMWVFGARRVLPVLVSLVIGCALLAALTYWSITTGGRA